MRFVTFFSCMVLSISSMAQRGYQFDRLELVKGLQNRSITSVVQDDIGFLWLGSQDGLIRYDGYEIRIYKSNLKDKNSLADNNIRALAKDLQGNLWIATQGGGLDKFNIRTEQFTHFKNIATDASTISGNAVWSVFVDSKGKVWAGTFSNGLNMIDPATNAIRRIEEANYYPVLSVTEDADGMIWFSSRGVSKINPADFSVRSFVPQPGDPESLSSGGIRSVWQDRVTKIFWVGAVDGGLFSFNPAEGSYTHRAFGEGAPAFSSVYTIFQDKNQTLWVGGNDGLALMAGEDVSFYQHQANDKYSISTSSVRAIAEDKFGNVWVGTEGGGVNKLLARKNFRVYRKSAAPGSISHNVIRSLYEDKQGIIWVGTQGGGLNQFDPATGTFTTVPVPASEISSVFQDQDETYWVGSWGSGLFHYDPVRKTIQNVRSNKTANGLPDDRIQVVHRDRDGVLWVGTENGLSTFDGKDQWTHFVKPNFPSELLGSNIQGQAFIEDSEGSIWIGTWFGLNKISKDRQQVTYYTTDTTRSFLSSDHVISLYLDSRNKVMWIGTFGGGLNRLDLETDQITHFTEEAGLPNNTIYAIRQDSDGNLWLSTNNGLSRFTPATETFRNYDATEGLQGNEFYWGAGYRTRSGHMMFGGVNGLTWFDPAEIRDNAMVPPLAITNFEIFNKPVTVGGNSVLAQNINFVPEVLLNYDQNVLTFEYTALNFNSPEKNLYAYYLENFDKEWNYVGNKRAVSYTNLNPGEYTLRVKGSNNDGIWNQEGIALKIVVIPPFWRTWWFYVLVGIVSVAAVYLLIRIRLRSVRRDKELIRRTLQEALDKAHAELDREKQAVLDEQSKNLQRNWIDQSVSIISEILSRSKDDVGQLCSQVISALVKRCEVVAGAIYLFNEDEQSLVKTGNYGFNNSRTSIAAGTGLIGECFDKRQPILINNLPENYYTVASGLGSAPPRSLLLVPLQYEEICVGVIELASFVEIESYRKQFIETLSAQLTATIHTTQISDRTSKLLEESRIQTEELKIREEELKQNLEEMQAIQENYSRKSVEYEEIIAQLKNRLEVSKQ